MTASADAEALPAPAIPPPAPDPGATRDRIPLAALRGRGGAGDPALHWSTRPDETDRRGLVMPARTQYALPLVLDRPLRLQAEVELPPGVWRLGSERVAAVAVVAALDAHGERRQLWTATLRSAASLADRIGARADCVVPATTRTLVLQASAAFDGPDPPAVIWLEPALVDPAAAPDPPAAAPRRAAGKDAVTRPAGVPRFSILTPVHDPPPAILRAAIESVRGQTLDDWELCLCDDGSVDPAVRALLQEHAAADPRIRLVRHEHAQGVSAATNAALALAGGEYLALLDHDDLLVPNALELVAAALDANPRLDMLYSDEDVWDRGRVTTRIVKPGWSPENLTQHMYTTHLGVYRRALAQQIGGFRTEFDGGQDYDFVLRLLERCDHVAHLPAQLYLWRAHEASTAGGAAAKPAAYLTHPRVIAEHLARTGVDAEIRFGVDPGVHRIIHAVDPAARVTVVLASDEPAAAASVARSLAEQPHHSWDLIVATHPEAEESVRDALHGTGVDVTRLAVAPGSGSIPERLKQAARTADGTYLFVLRAAAIGLTNEWLTAPLGYALQPGIGAAGPLMLDSGGLIVDAGLVFPQGIAVPLTEGVPGEQAPTIAMNVSAVSEAMVTSRALLDELGGLDAQYGELVLSEFCVRALQAGYRIVNVPDARLQRVGSDPIVNDLGALWRLRRRWLATRGDDPLYNARLRPDRGDRTALITS